MEYLSYVAEVRRFWILQRSFHILNNQKQSLYEFWFILILSFNSQIHDEEVSLRVNPEFQHSYTGEPLDVEFSYNRLEQRLYLNFSYMFTVVMSVGFLTDITLHCQIEHETVSQRTRTFKRFWRE